MRTSGSGRVVGVRGQVSKLTALTQEKLASQRAARLEAGKSTRDTMKRRRKTGQKDNEPAFALT